jgi:hypothetical protein
MSTESAPSGRENHAAVWTGSEMLVWGGKNSNTDSSPLGDGGRFDPVTNTWQSLPTDDGPGIRDSPFGVWTGDRFIVFGGRPDPAPVINTGVAFDPGSGTWAPISSTSAPFLTATESDGAFWIGDRILVVNTGGEMWTYEPVADQWEALGDTLNFGTSNSIEQVGYGDGQLFAYLHIRWQPVGQDTHYVGVYTYATNTWSLHAERELSTTSLSSNSSVLAEKIVWTGRVAVFWNAQFPFIFDPSTSSTFVFGNWYRMGAARWNEFTATWCADRVLIWGGDTSPDIAPGIAYFPDREIGKSYIYVKE